MPTLQKQIIYVYNKFCKTFIREIKNLNPDVKESLKKNYLCFDKQSDEYLIDFKSECDKIRQLEDIFLSGDLNNKDIIDQIEILKDIKFGDIEAESKYYYMSIFYLLCKLYADADSAPDDDKKTSGLKAILVCALKILNGGYDEEDVLDEIFDDSYRALLQNVTKYAIEESVEEDMSMPEMLSGINDTKIGKLAQEISGQIDLSSINPGSMNNINDLFSGENNAMSSIIQQVSSVMADKMQKGELDQEELMQEAFTMMGKVKNDDLFQQMMQQQ